MNEQQQAEVLAAWLDAGGPPPDGVDGDVVEAALVLRPALAPRPRVSVDEILADVRSGPLSSEATWAPANQPRPARWSRYVSAGVVGTFAAAAVALLVIVPAERPSAPAAVAPEAAPALGIPELQEASKVKRGDRAPATPGVASAPLATQEPSRQKASSGAPDVSAVPEASAPPGGGPSPLAGGGGLAGAPAAPAPAEPPPAPKALAKDEAPRPTEREAPTDDAVVDGAASATEEAEREEAKVGRAIALDASENTAAPALAKKAPIAEAAGYAQRSSEDQSDADEPDASWSTGMDASARSAIEGALARAARLSRQDPIAAAKQLETYIKLPARAGAHVAAEAATYALSGGDPSLALTLCDRGLALSSGASPEVTRLRALRQRAVEASQ